MKPTFSAFFSSGRVCAKASVVAWPIGKTEENGGPVEEPTAVRKARDEGVDGKIARMTAADSTTRR